MTRLPSPAARVTSLPYSGPVPVVTTAEARLMLPLLQGRSGFEPLIARLTAAVAADPAWREPIR